MGCINISLSEDNKYFLAKNITCDDIVEDSSDVSLDELISRMKACKEFYNKFEEELNQKLADN